MRSTKPLLISCSVLYLAALCGAVLQAANLALLHKGQHLHLAVVAHGELCEVRLKQRLPHSLTVQVISGKSVCGSKDSVISIPEELILDMSPEETLTKRRIAARCLLGVGGLAVLSAVPLTSSDPETWFLIANPVTPAFSAFLGRKAMPARRDYFVLLNCPDPASCLLPSAHTKFPPQNGVKH